MPVYRNVRVWIVVINRRLRANILLVVVPCWMILHAQKW